MKEHLRLPYVAFVLSVLFTVIQGCTYKRPVIMETKLPVFRGYEPGNMVSVREDIDQPEIRQTIEWLKERGFPAETTTPIPIAMVTSKRTEQFRLFLEGKMEKESYSASANALIGSLESAELNIDEGERYWLTAGEGGINNWLDGLNTNDPKDSQVILRLNEPGSEHLKKELLVIKEVIRVKKGSYSFKWKKNIDTEAKASLTQAISLAGKIKWIDDSSASWRIEPESPVIVEHIYYSLPDEKINKLYQRVMESKGNRIAYSNPQGDIPSQPRLKLTVLEVTCLDLMNDKKGDDIWLEIFEQRSSLNGKKVKKVLVSQRLVFKNRDHTISSNLGAFIKNSDIENPNMQIFMSLYVMHKRILLNDEKYYTTKLVDKKTYPEGHTIEFKYDNYTSREYLVRYRMESQDDNH